MRTNRRRYAKIGNSNIKVAFIFSTVIAGIIAIGAVANITLQSSIGAISKQIRRLENESNNLRIEAQRAQSAWSLCTTPEQLEKSLTRHGLHMELARGEKIVYLIGKKPGKIDGLSSPQTEVATYVPNQQTFR